MRKRDFQHRDILASNLALQGCCSPRPSERKGQVMLKLSFRSSKSEKRANKRLHTSLRRHGSARFELLSTNGWVRSQHHTVGQQAHGPHVSKNCHTQVASTNYLIPTRHKRVVPSAVRVCESFRTRRAHRRCTSRRYLHALCYLSYTFPYSGINYSDRATKPRQKGCRNSPMNAPEVNRIP